MYTGVSHSDRKTSEIKVVINRKIIEISEVPISPEAFLNDLDLKNIFLYVPEKTFIKSREFVYLFLKTGFKPL